MAKRPGLSSEARERAVRLVYEHERRIPPVGLDIGRRPGVTTEEHARGAPPRSISRGRRAFGRPKSARPIGYVSAGNGPRRLGRMAGEHLQHFARGKHVPRASQPHAHEVRTACSGLPARAEGCFHRSSDRHPREARILLSIKRRLTLTQAAQPTQV